MVSDEMQSALKTLLIGHEGKENLPYTDTVGKLTIGIGYNLTDRGLPDEWINNQFKEDVNFFYAQLCKDYTWFQKLDENRQMALIDMCFMGYKRFQGFVHMLRFIAIGYFENAAQEMLKSLWASQVKKRAQDLAEIIRTGEIK